MQYPRVSRKKKNLTIVLISTVKAPDASAGIVDDSDASDVATKELQTVTWLKNAIDKEGIDLQLLHVHPMIGDKGIESVHVRSDTLTRSLPPFYCLRVVAVCSYVL